MFLYKQFVLLLLLLITLSINFFLRDDSYRHRNYNLTLINNTIKIYYNGFKIVL